MAIQLDFSADEINKTIGGRLYSPIQDVVGNNYTSAATLQLLPNTSLSFLCNGAIRNFKNLPSHITNMWDTVNNKVVLNEFQDTPAIGTNLSFMIDPATSAEGIVTISAYVDETVPLLIKSTNVHFKGDVEKLTGSIKFYAGSETGFDVKNKGVIFTLESNVGAEVYDTSIEIIRD